QTAILGSRAKNYSEFLTPPTLHRSNYCCSMLPCASTNGRRGNTNNEVTSDVEVRSDVVRKGSTNLLLSLSVRTFCVTTLWPSMELWESITCSRLSCRPMWPLHCRR
ncbi:unnamed protein product, partial [Ectocarpus sp. 8 AP-2014]